MHYAKTPLTTTVPVKLYEIKLLLQCKPGSGLDCQKHGHSSCEHVEMMVQDRLVKLIYEVKKKFPTQWKPEQWLQGNREYDNNVIECYSSIAADVY